MRATGRLVAGLLSHQRCMHECTEQGPIQCANRTNLSLLAVCVCVCVCVCVSHAGYATQHGFTVSAPSEDTLYIDVFSGGVVMTVVELG